MAIHGNTAMINPVAVLSKKERKQLRKQMTERKQQLLAKHGRGGARLAKASKPTLPPDPTRSTLPTWTPPAQPAPSRTLPLAEESGVERSRGERLRRSLRPRGLDAGSPHKPITTPFIPAVVDLDGTGPGPLTRAAVLVERESRRIVRVWQQRPWREVADAPRRSQTHRGLSLIIKPLRVLGMVSIVGALMLGRESRNMGATDTGSLVVLGMGLGLAVLLLALAEIAGAMRMIVRRL